MAGSGQLVLDLPARPALGRADFFVSPANALALAQVDAWPDWPARRLAVVGPAGAGKTHLVHVWAARSGANVLAAADLGAIDPAAVPAAAALAVEDADRLEALPGAARRAAEEALFHLCNRLALSGSLMLTGRSAPALWPVALPDLASRLRTAGVARLDSPDDALLSALLVKLFADRQIAVGPDLIRYLLGRIERSFAAAEAAVVALDRAGLARKRPITLRLAAEVLSRDAD
ncbi:MAG: chromosomal replication initiator DnaA [Rhodobacteraceae bacterium]|nr:chromosomal replication initiator DnaA [Paracoccaceae bacterium]